MFVAFLPVVGYSLKVDEVSADDVRVNRIIVPQLDLDALAQRWEHFRKHNLLIPHRSVAVLLHRCAALNIVDDAV